MMFKEFAANQLTPNAAYALEQKYGTKIKISAALAIILNVMIVLELKSGI